MAIKAGSYCLLAATIHSLSNIYCDGLSPLNERSGIRVGGGGELTYRAHLQTTSVTEDLSPPLATSRHIGPGNGIEPHSFLVDAGQQGEAVSAAPFDAEVACLAQAYLL